MPRFSIFLKLILIVILFGVIIDLAVLFVIRISTNRERGLMHKSEKVLISMIGSPPDTVKANRIIEEMGWEMRYESPDYNWTSSAVIPKLDEIKESAFFNERISHDDYFAFSFKQKFYLIFKTQKGIFIVQPESPRDVFDEQRAILSLVVLLTVIIISLYFIIRKLFRPLKLLTTAVHEVGEGNYYIDIPIKRKDELGELAGSISSMASKIGDSIKAKEQLLLDVSHELRTPLTRIKLGLEVDSSKDKINEDVIEMEAMITGLLESYRSESKISDLTRTDINIVELIEETIDEYLSIERIKFRNPGKSVLLKIDEEKIQTVIRNIISNALKYSSGDVEISVEDGIKNASVTIKDSGIGISDSDLPHIFEPFYRADQSRSRARGGFGLGLSICKKIIDAHKAKIIVKSKLNSGTEFTLIFNKLV